MRVAALLSLLSLSNAAGISSANAQSASCAQLQNKLSTLTVGGGYQPRASAEYRKYDRAVKNQRTQINKTRRMAQRNRCNTRVIITRNSSTCGRILASLEKMSTNLTALEQQRQRLAPRQVKSVEEQRRDVIRLMSQRGCIDNYNVPQVAPPVVRRRSLVEQLFGVRTFSNDGRRGIFERPEHDFSSSYNTYRTMCVRKQDGYYFPVSFSTTPDRFEYDERVCLSKCPGTDVALYFHAMPTQDSEDMVAYRGQEPYADLPSAFAYRKKYDPKATCRYSAGVLQDVTGFLGDGAQLTDLSGSSPTRIGTPVFRRDRSMDPESMANLDGRFNEPAIKRLLMSPQEIAKEQAIALAGRKVRVVGPAFYPVQ